MHTLFTVMVYAGARPPLLPRLRALFHAACCVAARRARRSGRSLPLTPHCHSSLPPCPHPAALAIGSKYNKSDVAIWLKIGACFLTVFVLWDIKPSASRRCSLGACAWRGRRRMR